MQNDHTALERLAVFLGEWRMEASFPSAAPAASVASGVSGRAVFRRVLDGQFLALEIEIPHPDAPDSWAIIGVAANGQTYTQHYFDTRGVARVYAMTFRDGLWTLLREAPDFTPLDFAQRFTGRFSDDGRTIVGRWEQRTGGATWQHDFDLTYTRVS